MPQRAAQPALRFDGTVNVLETAAIVRLPQKVSTKLPSRGQVAVRGTINGRAFETVLEPDGEFGHWMRVDRTLQQAAAVKAGATVKMEIQPVKEWPEPALPKDFESALHAAPRKIQQLWQDITPMARWEWVRWVNATSNPDTRRRRVEVSLSKMGSGKRRPCCFNLASCTDPNLARNGKLFDPADG